VWKGGGRRKKAKNKGKREKGKKRCSPKPGKEEKPLDQIFDGKRKKGEKVTFKSANRKKSFLFEGGKRGRRKREGSVTAQKKKRGVSYFFLGKKEGGVKPWGEKGEGRGDAVLPFPLGKKGDNKKTNGEKSGLPEVLFPGEGRGEKRQAFPKNTRGKKGKEKGNRDGKE